MTSSWGTTLVLQCSVQNFKTIWSLSNRWLANEISRDLNIRCVSDGYPTGGYVMSSWWTHCWLWCSQLIKDSCWWPHSRPRWSQMTIDIMDSKHFEAMISSHLFAPMLHVPGRRQAIIWTNFGMLWIGPLGTNFSEIHKTCHSWKCISKYRLGNGDHFVQGEMRWYQWSLLKGIDRSSPQSAHKSSDILFCCHSHQEVEQTV